jgi:dUTP pyrophosphatase
VCILQYTHRYTTRYTMATFCDNDRQDPSSRLEQYVKMFYHPNMLRNFAILKLWVNPEKPELVELYKQHIEKHNAQMKSDYPNAGFDLFVPEDTDFSESMKTHMVNLDVRGEMLFTDLSSGKTALCYTTGYYMYPRSSMSKTPLMLANHTGIIDSGYRGNLIAAVRLLSDKPYVVDKYTRLLQICHPQLCAVYVVMVDERELSTTARGNGGFGSTGLKG